MSGHAGRVTLPVGSALRADRMTGMPRAAQSVGSALRADCVGMRPADTPPQRKPHPATLRLRNCGEIFLNCDIRGGGADFCSFAPMRGLPRISLRRIGDDHRLAQNFGVLLHADLSLRRTVYQISVRRVKPLAKDFLQILYLRDFNKNMTESCTYQPHRWGLSPPANGLRRPHRTTSRKMSALHTLSPHRSHTLSPHRSRAPGPRRGRMPGSRLSCSTDPNKSSARPRRGLDVLICSDGSCG